MLITIEKVMIMRTVRIFASVPDAILAEIVPFAKELNFTEGSLIIKKGDWDTSLYIIVKGEAKVEDNDVCIATLKDGEVFGEMAALAPECRSANVIATQDCLLLQLSHRSLEDILAQHPEVAMGIIETLCQRLRSTLELLGDKKF